MAKTGANFPSRTTLTEEGRFDTTTTGGELRCWVVDERDVVKVVVDLLIRTALSHATNPATKTSRYAPLTTVVRTNLNQELELRECRLWH